MNWMLKHLKCYEPEAVWDYDFVKQRKRLYLNIEVEYFDYDRGHVGPKRH